MSRLQHFGWFLARGFGPQGWGERSLDWNYRWTDPRMYQESARVLDQAGFDLLVIEDALSLGDPATVDLRVRHAFGGPKHDPLALAPYLFAATEHLGIAPTVNPAAYPPYTAARLLASLHHLSGHRLGVNVVTDTGSARHFGADAPLAHDDAYDRAEEWMAGVRDLWHSWPADALIEDAASARFADGSRLRAERHRGDYYDFDGPLNAIPFTDGDPIVVSPGGSPRGLAFAGVASDVQLALSPLDPASVRAYRARVHEQALRAGRNPEDVTILFAVQPVIVPSADEADRIVAASADPDLDTLRLIAARQSSDLETDLTGLDLDRPLDPAIFGEHVSHGSIARLIGGHDPDAPLRVLLAEQAKLGRLSDRSGFVGTAEEFADLVEELADDADNDGLLLWGDLHPVTVHAVLDTLVPVLRRRGLLRTEFDGRSIRDNLHF